MSLIPSESASFPDLLGRGLGASKKSKWRLPDEIASPASEPRVAKEKPVPKPAVNARSPQATPKRQPPSEPPVKPKAEVAPAVVPVLPEQAPAPVPLPEAKEVPKPVHAPIPIVRIVRSMADRAVEPNVVDPAPEATGPIQRQRPVTGSQPVIPPPRTPLAKPRLRPRPTLHPRFEGGNVFSDSRDSRESAPEARSAVPVSPVPVALKSAPPLNFTPAPTADEVEEFGFPEPASTWPVPRRRRARLLRFALCELFALLVLAVAVMVGLAHRLPEDPVSLMAKIATILSAIAVAVIPIGFYGLPETLPRSNR